MNFPHILTGKQNTKKVREIQFLEIPIVTVTIFKHFFVLFRFNYGIIVQSDLPCENTQREVLDLCQVHFPRLKSFSFLISNLSSKPTHARSTLQIACEKFAPSEKPPKERNNEAAATMIKVRRFSN